MNYASLRSRAVLFLLLLAISNCVLAMTSCTSNTSKVKQAVQEYLKEFDVKEIVVDVFYVSPEVPDKAYASATVTYGFASSKGRPQREFTGYIMAREGAGWRVETTTKYTKEEKQAALFLAGSK